jgi:hypothetical protein
MTPFKVRAKLKQVRVNAKGYEILKARPLQLGFYVGELNKPLWRAELTRHAAGLPRSVMEPVEVEALTRSEAKELVAREYKQMGVEAMLR